MTKTQNKVEKFNNIESRIKHLKGKSLTEENYNIYCFGCNKLIKGWEFWIPFRIQHCCIGWRHRNC